MTSPNADPPPDLDPRGAGRLTLPVIAWTAVWLSALTVAVWRWLTR